MDIAIALISAVVAGALVWWWAHSSKPAVITLANAADPTFELLKQLQSENSGLQKRIAELTADKARLETQFESERQRLVEQEKRAQQYLADIERMRTSLQTEFQVVASKLLEEKSATFTEHNKTQIDTLLNPLKQQLTEFRTRIDTVYKTESDDRTTLKTQIEQLRQLNVRITDEAHSLTQALKGQSQVRGAWGELILEHLLESADLKKDQDFLVQESITTEDGRRLRPDVILRLPDQRHLVIDSKLSLVAYERAVNAPTEAERDAATAEHVRAVRTHVEELSSKRYEDTGKLVTPDYVLMFVPLESAFITALKADQALYQWAFDRRVILCTAPTLLVTLKTVAGLWKQDRQTKNVQEIARRGGMLYDKFAGLYSDLEAIGTHLTRARESYDDVLGKLKSGRGNLLSQVEELKTLGAKAQKSLPAADAIEE